MRLVTCSLTLSCILLVAQRRISATVASSSNFSSQSEAVNLTVFQIVVVSAADSPVVDRRDGWVDSDITLSPLQSLVCVTRADDGPQQLDG